VLAGKAGIGRTVPSTLLMSWENKVKVLRIVDGIKDGQDGSSRIAKDVFHIWVQGGIIS
jgi:hypothetical protein